MISYKQSMIVLACNIMQIAQYTLLNVKPAGTVLAPLWHPVWHPCCTPSGTPVAPGPSLLWYPICHPCGTRSGTPMAPGLSPRWHPLVTFNCGCLIWCHLRVPFGHHIFWVPNGALWGVVFWTRVWHLKRCHMAPFIATVCMTCNTRDHTVLPATYTVIPAFIPQLQSITVLWLVLTSRPAEGTRLSWPVGHVAQKQM